ncbi:hypothetical protein [Paracoccus sp. (in: a-proteobacteria)]|uniref:hypothetical protein n=1 Tax=Paracoccus sp. TaxID=267 RepID=UPI002B000958|nr:hypothetical protein [Paracoccus sp. (in: a-proteobacteria)]
MMDEPYSEPDRASWRSALARLVARAGWLAGIFVVFLALVLVGELKPGGALAGFVLALLGLALLPVGSMRGRRIEAAPSLPAPDEEAAVFAFADALADPCLVLDRRSAVVHANAAASRQFPTLVPGPPITFFLRNPELVQAIDLAMRGAETRAVELHETVPSETWDRVVVSPLRRPAAIGWAMRTASSSLPSRASPSSSASRPCAAISSPMPAMSCARRWPRFWVSSTRFWARRPGMRRRARNSSTSCAARPTA